MYSELNKLKEEENEQIPGELSLNIKFGDIFEFVDTGCCHFLTNVSLMASTFLQLFNKQVYNFKKLKKFLFTFLINNVHF